MSQTDYFLDNKLPIERHGEDGISVTVDDVDRDSLADVPDDNQVIIAGTYKDVLSCGMPLNNPNLSPAKCSMYSTIPPIIKPYL